MIVAHRGVDSQLSGTESMVQLELRSIACIPLQRFRPSERTDSTSTHLWDIQGVLYVDSRQSREALSRTSLSMLESLAFEASKALESLRLMQEGAEKLRLERELAMAREVQVALLTSSLLDADHVEAAAHSIPSRHVDGDFYDLFDLPGGRSVIVLGDVSGKGISAALLASMFQGIVEAQLIADHSISSVITGLNRMLVQKSASRKIVTLFCAVLDSKGNLIFVNAGHNPPIVLRASGQMEVLSTNSLIVGAFDFATYPEAETRLAPGDILVAFTDGVTEALNSAGEMFGDQRLQEVIRSATTLGAVQIRDCILDQVATHSRGLPQDDDITVVALKMKPIRNSEERVKIGA
jgi:serine phosphatase RsbU (regulator of sigma subunit)